MEGFCGDSHKYYELYFVTLSVGFIVEGSDTTEMTMDDSLTNDINDNTTVGMHN